ncbi:MAG: hypothetical protein ACPG5P_03605, partial [Saprospiraceae bacterium]
LKIIEKDDLRRSHKKTFYKIGPIEILGVFVKQNKIDISDEKIESFNNEENLLKKEGKKNYFKQINNRNKKPVNKERIKKIIK